MYIKPSIIEYLVITKGKLITFYPTSIHAIPIVNRANKLYLSYKVMIHFYKWCFFPFLLLNENKILDAKEKLNINLFLDVILNKNQLVIII